MAKQPPKKKVPAPKGAELKLESKSSIKGKEIRTSFYNSVGGERTVARAIRSNKQRVADTIREEKVKSASKVGKYAPKDKPSSKPREISTSQYWRNVESAATRKKVASKK